MSVQDQLDRIKSNVSSTYSALSEMGADQPAAQNTDNLAETVLTIKAVRYDAQTLTDEQKAQARANIGALDSAYFVTTYTPSEDHTLATADHTLEEQLAAYNEGKTLLAAIEGLAFQLFEMSSTSLGYGFYQMDFDNNLMCNFQLYHSSEGGIALAMYEIPIPTATSQLTNDSGFQTGSQVDTKIVAAIGTAIGGSY